MSVLSVVKDVCLAVGVNPPTSLFASSIQPRTQAELLSLANEMAQRIAYDTRDWQVLCKLATIYGDGVKTSFDLPVDYQRMLLTTELRRASSPGNLMTFISDADEWVYRRMTSAVHSFGEWTIFGGQIHFEPVLPLGDAVQFAYLEKNCCKKIMPAVELNDHFVQDDDEYRLGDRLLKLGMIWQWKAHKGSPYAEDLSTYSDAIVLAMGRDKPAPILIDKQPLRLPMGGVVASVW